ncbi:DUF2470 domain-containing protein [Pseudonocardia sp.]|uniref:DUF2470 domain-containing protein n=1 Tax=Pseudonocardia sp. TaxID=60912 RepID=UPI00260C2EBB|nr:DUF2470 domain-containing protein [Pseudonocardia sp.]
MPIAPIVPAAAERARTVLGHTPTSVLEVGADLAVVLDVLAVDVDGTLVTVVDAGGPLADRPAGHAVIGTLRAALVSPVPGPDRRLDAVTVHGTVEVADDVRTALDVLLAAHGDRPADLVLRPEASVLLRIRVAQLRLDGEPVDPDAYARAVADPMAGGSDEFVEHLLRAHPEQVVRLAHLLDPDVVQDAHAVAPERVDRFGLTVRVDTPAGTRRARLDFPAALRGPAELPAAMRALQSRAAQVTVCPFGGGTRAPDRSAAPSPEPRQG